MSAPQGTALPHCRIAILDSGIHPEHPHAGGVAIIGDSLKDHLGHGTAVAATIRQHAPDALLYAVKIFNRRLSCSLETLARAVDWCVANDIEIINLSAAISDPAPLQPAIDRGIVVVSSLTVKDGDLDSADGRRQGLSFAIANATGQLAAKRRVPQDLPR